MDGSVWTMWFRKVQQGLWRGLEPKLLLRKPCVRQEWATLVRAVLSQRLGPVGGRRGLWATSGHSFIAQLGRG